MPEKDWGCLVRVLHQVVARDLVIGDVCPRTLWVPNGLVPMPKFDIKDVLPHAVIDTDHFVEGRIPLDFDKIDEQLSALHATIKLVFEATISPHAQAVWA